MATIPTPPSPSHPPSFESLDYWEKRYLNATHSYDWLNEADILDKHILPVISASQVSNPQILHVGCGNSDLSFNLRMMVQDPAQVHNVDYSRNVVDWGREREREMFDFSHGGDDDDDDDEVGANDNDVDEDLKMPMMRWSAIDLTDMTSVIRACELGAYTIFVDKSTSDCFACASVAEAPVPYPLYTGDTLQDDHIDLSDAQSKKVSALQILAVHLALLARPRAVWIVYSYSESRFVFFDEDYHEDDHVARVLKMHDSIPQPRDLWTLLKKETIVRREDAENPDELAASSSNVVQAPKLHFIYIFERSDVELKVRSL